MRQAALIVAGNAYIADRARAAGNGNVVILPTVVDLDRYPTAPLGHSSGKFTIGWIGSSSTAKYLNLLQEPLQRLCENGSAELTVIGASGFSMAGVPVHKVDWSEESEVASMQAFDIGIMPLQDTPWERGKCGLKLIQYMATYLPVIASSVGVNTEIVEHGTDGFLAVNPQDWEQAIRILRDNANLRHQFGKAGRHKVNRKYALAVTAPIIDTLLKQAATRK